MPVMVVGCSAATVVSRPLCDRNSARDARQRGVLGVTDMRGSYLRLLTPDLSHHADPSPKHLRSVIKEIKEGLDKPDLPFGVDLLLPQVGGSARKTNYDYTKGQLDDLIDVIIEEKAKLFVCAVGVPPKHIVDKLHKHGILVMNMIGHPKHADKALAQGVDIICAQGGEGGGHTGSIPTSILIPAVVDRVKGKTSPLTGQPIYVVAAGAMADGRGLAAALMWGAQGVWVGTRFVASTEAGAPKKHKELVVSAGHGDTNTTLIYTGRPLRVRRTDYVKQWEDRQDEIKTLTSQGKLPHEVELSKKPELSLPGRPWVSTTLQERPETSWDIRKPQKLSEMLTSRSSWEMSPL